MTRLTKVLHSIFFRIFEFSRFKRSISQISIIELSNLLFKSYINRGFKWNQPFPNPPRHSKKDLHWNMCVLLELINISIEDSSKLRIVVSRFETSLVKFSTNPRSRSNCFLIVPPRWDYLVAKKEHENRIRDGQFLYSNHVDNI